jgi:type II secretory pathway component PulF
MRFFQYEATDSSNRMVQGTMQATDEGVVRTSLQKAGLNLVRCREMGAGAPPTRTAAPPVVQQRPIAPNSPSPYPTGGPSQSPPNAQVIHTKQGTDKQRFFLFSQLASALRAGINPAQAFIDISQRSAAQFEQSLRVASQEATQGVPLSVVFARYPDLYPEHVVGVVKAGEMAGFLPEALEEVAKQAQVAHSFNRWFFWVWFVVINFLLSIPGMWVVTRSLLGTYDAIDKTGGTGAGGGQMSPTEATGDFMSVLWRETLWPWGPITVVVYGGIWVFQRYYSSRVAKRARHQMGLKFPVYGARARHENLARFAWTMSRVSRAGVSPARAWQLAAESVPNIIFRDELMGIGRGLQGSERMSDLVFKSKLFPEEYAPMVATGEYTGDLSGALDKLAQVSEGEFVAAQNYAKVRSGCWGALGCFITSAIMLGMFWYAWYIELPAKVLKGFDE